MVVLGDGLRRHTRLRFFKGLAAPEHIERLTAIVLVAGGVGFVQELFSEFGASLGVEHLDLTGALVLDELLVTLHVLDVDSLEGAVRDNNRPPAVDLDLGLDVGHSGLLLQNAGLHLVVAGPSLEEVAGRALLGHFFQVLGHEVQFFGLAVEFELVGAEDVDFLHELSI